MNSITSWVAEKLTQEGRRIKVSGQTPEGFLIIEESEGYKFLVAVLNLQNVINVAHVQPIFDGTNQPQLVINVPSKTLWSGEAIEFIHSKQAAFGVMGDIARAASTYNAGMFRDKNMGFFINAIEQHGNVSTVSYLYDSVFRVNRFRGASLTIAVINAYNMSAEDVRNAKTRVGTFDVIVKSTNYGSITEQAEAAAASMNAQALTFKDLMRCLAI